MKALLLLPLLAVLTVKDGHRGSEGRTPDVPPPDIYAQSPPKEGLVMRWRFLRPPGKTPNTGPFLRTLELAQKDLWENGTTKTQTQDGYVSKGKVHGTIIVPCPPTPQKESDDDVLFEKEDPSLPMGRTRIRWKVLKEGVVMIAYAKEHAPKYTYFTEDSKPLETKDVPPNIPQNKPVSDAGNQH